MCTRRIYVLFIHVDEVIHVDKVIHSASSASTRGGGGGKVCLIEDTPCHKPLTRSNDK